MRRRRLPGGLIVPVALVVLVAVLAWLQFKWLGQVSDAERDRMRTSLRQNADEFANDFDRELTKLYDSLQVDGTTLLQHNWTPFAGRFDGWREKATYPQLAKAVYLVTDDNGRFEYFAYRPDARVFDAATWPDALAPVKATLVATHPPAGAAWASQTTSTPGATVISDRAINAASAARAVVTQQQVLASIPALMISLPSVSALQGTPLPQPTPAIQTFSFTSLSGFDLRINRALLVVELDREYIKSTLLPTLGKRYFGHEEYRFAIVDNADNAHPLFNRGFSAAGVDPQRADANVSLFAVRPDLIAQVILKPAGTDGDTKFTLEDRSFTTSLPRATGIVTTTSGAPPPPPPPANTARVQATNLSIVVGGRGDFFTARPTRAGAWQLVVQHTAGSLDAAVGQARRRNLWLSFGILSVLAAGVGLIVVNAERSRKLAVQQMDFVATVSHELRTPLTVIRSAAQNLSAGVVSDPAQAKRYGDLIESEGRRLTDMVEQVLEYAGLSGNRTLARTQPVDAGAVVRDVVESSASLFESDRIEVELQIEDSLPPVLADEHAVRRALNNLIANAMKYGAEGRWIGVSARRARGSGGLNTDEVRISVSDRGRGIEAADLPHIFEAFYRGRYAVDRQIHGNGLGLSLVKRIAEAHGGRASVTSAPGQGAVFTIHLPAATPDAAAYHANPDPLAESGTPTA